MKKKRLTQKERRKIVESVVGKVPWDKFTPGIYNNCDRWCEKCKKTKKCYLFWEEQKEGKPKNMAEALESIGRQLGQANDLIYKICDAEGIDLTMTPEEEAEYEKKERLTDPKNDPVAIKANKLSKMIYQWLDSVPALDIPEYQEAYEKVSWHWPLIGVKTSMAIHCQKEAAIEAGPSRKFAREQQKKYSWMAYRSAQICKKSFEIMDRYVNDFRIQPIIEDCGKVIKSIDKKLIL